MRYYRGILNLRFLSDSEAWQEFGLFLLAIICLGIFIWVCCLIYRGFKKHLNTKVAGILTAVVLISGIVLMYNNDYIKEAARIIKEAERTPHINKVNVAEEIRGGKPLKETRRSLEGRMRKGSLPANMEAAIEAVGWKAGKSTVTAESYRGLLEDLNKQQAAVNGLKDGDVKNYLTELINQKKQWILQEANPLIKKQMDVQRQAEEVALESQGDFRIQLLNSLKNGEPLTVEQIKFIQDKPNIFNKIIDQRNQKFPDNQLNYDGTLKNVEPTPTPAKAEEAVPKAELESELLSTTPEEAKAPEVPENKPKSSEQPKEDTGYNPDEIVRDDWTRSDLDLADKFTKITTRSEFDWGAPRKPVKLSLDEIEILRKVYNKYLENPDKWYQWATFRRDFENVSGPQEGELRAYFMGRRDVVRDVDGKIMLVNDKWTPAEILARESEEPGTFTKELLDKAKKQVSEANTEPAPLDATPESQVNYSESDAQKINSKAELERDMLSTTPGEAKGPEVPAKEEAPGEEITSTYAKEPINPDNIIQQDSFVNPPATVTRVEMPNPVNTIKRDISALENSPYLQQKINEISSIIRDSDLPLEQRNALGNLLKEKVNALETQRSSVESTEGLDNKTNNAPVNETRTNSEAPEAPEYDIMADTRDIFNPVEAQQEKVIREVGTETNPQKTKGQRSREKIKAWLAGDSNKKRKTKTKETPQVGRYVGLSPEQEVMEKIDGIQKETSIDNLKKILNDERAQGEVADEDIIRAVKQRIQELEQQVVPVTADETVANPTIEITPETMPREVVQNGNVVAEKLKPEVSPEAPFSGLMDGESTSFGNSILKTLIDSRADLPESGDVLTLSNEWRTKLENAKKSITQDAEGRYKIKYDGQEHPVDAKYVQALNNKLSELDSSTLERTVLNNVPTETGKPITTNTNTNTNAEEALSRVLASNAEQDDFNIIVKAFKDGTLEVKGELGEFMAEQARRQGYAVEESTIGGNTVYRVKPSIDTVSKETKLDGTGAAETAESLPGEAAKIEDINNEVTSQAVDENVKGLKTDEVDPFIPEVDTFVNGTSNKASKKPLSAENFTEDLPETPVKLPRSERKKLVKELNQKREQLNILELLEKNPLSTIRYPGAISKLRTEIRTLEQELQGSYPSGNIPLKETLYSYSSKTFDKLRESLKKNLEAAKKQLQEADASGNVNATAQASARIAEIENNLQAIDSITAINPFRPIQARNIRKARNLVKKTEIENAAVNNPFEEIFGNGELNASRDGKNITINLNPVQKKLWVSGKVIPIGSDGNPVSHTRQGGRVIINEPADLYDLRGKDGKTIEWHGDGTRLAKNEAPKYTTDYLKDQPKVPIDPPVMSVPKDPTVKSTAEIGKNPWPGRAKTVGKLLLADSAFNAGYSLTDGLLTPDEDPDGWRAFLPGRQEDLWLSGNKKEPVSFKDTLQGLTNLVTGNGAPTSDGVISELSRNGNMVLFQDAKGNIRWQKITPERSVEIAPDAPGSDSGKLIVMDDKTLTKEEVQGLHSESTSAGSPNYKALKVTRVPTTAPARASVVTPTVAQPAGTPGTSVNSGDKIPTTTTDDNESSGNYDLLKYVVPDNFNKLPYGHSLFGALAGGAIGAGVGGINYMMTDENELSEEEKKKRSLARAMLSAAGIGAGIGGVVGGVSDFTRPEAPKTTA